MLFNTPLFLLFFTTFFLLYSFIFLKRTPRLYLILVASFIFYAGWNFRFIPLIVLSAVVDYFVAIGISQAKSQSAKKWLLSLSIGTNLGILGIFKYSDFAMRSVAEFLLLFGYQVSPPVFAYVLPVGISFYTFQSMSYTIDVYRGDFTPRKGLLQFTTALAFFPQLVAGPILRARQILPQFETMPKPTWQGSKHGLVLITAGLTKKTIADLLAAPAAVVFNTGESVSLLETWTGVIAFAGQIYGDFSGYSDMAIGIGLVLGYQIPMNFRLPYLAVSPVDFWRRWHITLSTWLRDYLYISLGGNQKRRYINIMITMLLGGLWHGAAWTFVAWGFFHGCLIVATHSLSSIALLRSFVESKHWIITVIKWSITFYLMLIGWVLFRAVDIDSAFNILLSMHLFNELPEPAANAVLIAGLSMLALIVMQGLDFIIIRYGERLENRSWILWPLLILLHFFCFTIGEPGDAFIYFQF